MLAYVQDFSASSPEVDFVIRVLSVSSVDWRALYCISYVHKLLVRGPFQGLEHDAFWALDQWKLERHLIDVHLNDRVRSHPLRR